MSSKYRKIRGLKYDLDLFPLHEAGCPLTSLGSPF